MAFDLKSEATALRTPVPQGQAYLPTQPRPIADRDRSGQKSRSPSPTLYSVHFGAAAANTRDTGSFLALHKNKPVNFNDAHMHPGNYRQDGYKLDRYMQHMDELGIGYTTLMSIPTSLKGRTEPKLVDGVGICGCAPSYYLPRDLLEKNYITRDDVSKVCKLQTLYADTEVDDMLAERYKQLTESQKSRFDPMITGLHIGADDCSNRLLHKLERNRGVFTGVGEITIHKEVVDALMGEGWAHLKKNINPLIQLLYTCGEIGMPAVVHCDIDHYAPTPGKAAKYLDGLSKLFSHEHVSKTTIVWAHAGGLGRFVNAPDGHVRSLRALLTANPRLHVDISWTVVADKVVGDTVGLNEWKSLIQDFPDRFLFGSDTLAPASAGVWNATYEKYEALRDVLDETVVQKVFVDNYRRVFVDARKNVRRYEQERLGTDLERLQNAFEATGMQAPGIQASSVLAAAPGSGSSPTTFASPSPTTVAPASMNLGSALSTSTSTTSSSSTSSTSTVPAGDTRLQPEYV